jgi:hypothetical protein
MEASKGSAERGFRSATGFPSGHQKKTGTRKAQKETLQSLFLTIRRYLGDFSSLAKGIDDPRNQDKILYPLGSLMLASILGFVCRLRSAREWISFLRESPEVCQRFNALFPKAPGFPHPDTIRKTFGRLEVDQVQKVVTAAIARLIRSRALDGYRLLGKYHLVAIDATGLYSYKERHCANCLTRKHKDGQITYFHYALEAKLVTQDGLAISLMSEFIENPGDGLFDKQDCEFKAFQRLAKRLKKAFPKLLMTLLLDGLYACGTLFQICEDNHWKYITVLKKGSIPTLYADFYSLVKLSSESFFSVKTQDAPGGEESRKLRWVNDIQFTDTEQRTHRVHMLEACVEHSGKAAPSTWLWVTDIKVTRERADQIQRGGRCRWKIENEGFNVQKRNGYELEHHYSENWITAKILYLLLQLAHGIHQLLERGGLLKDIPSKVPLKGRRLAYNLLEALKNAPAWSQSYLRALKRKRFQLRLSSA